MHSEYSSDLWHTVGAAVALGTEPHLPFRDSSCIAEECRLGWMRRSAVAHKVWSGGGTASSVRVLLAELIGHILRMRVSSRVFAVGETALGQAVSYCAFDWRKFLVDDMLTVLGSSQREYSAGKTQVAAEIGIVGLTP